MKLTDSRFLDFIRNGKPGKTYYSYCHKDINKKKIFLILSGFNFNGTLGNNVYCLHISEDITDYPNTKVSILFDKNLIPYSYREHSLVISKDVAKMTTDITKDRFLSVVFEIGKEYPLLPNFFLWNTL